MNMDFYKKYIKYKTKYLQCKKIQNGGASKNDILLYIGDNFNAILDRLVLENISTINDIYNNMFIDITDNDVIQSIKHNTLDDNRKYLIEYIYNSISSVDPSGLKYCKYIINIYTHGEISWYNILNKLYYNLIILNLFQFKLFKNVSSMIKNFSPGNELDDVKQLNNFINKININKEYSLEKLIKITDINLLDIYGPSIFNYDELYDFNNIIPTLKTSENSNIYKDKLYDFMQDMYAQLGELSGELNEIQYINYTDEEDKEKFKIKMHKLFDRHNKIAKPLAKLKYLLIKYTGPDNNTKYFNNGTIIISPKDPISSIFYGRGTQWCTSGIRNNLFHSYSENGMHIVINILSGYKTQVGISMIANEQDKVIENEVFGSDYPHLFIDEEQVKKFKYDKKVQYTVNNTYDENLDCNKKLIEYIKSSLKNITKFKQFLNISLTECGNITTILIGSIEHRAIDVLKLLLNKGADVHTENNYKENLLHILVESANNSADSVIVERIVDILISHGIDINYESYGYTPFYKAFKDDKIKIAEILLNKGAHSNNSIIMYLTNISKMDYESEFMRLFMEKLDRNNFGLLLQKLSEEKKEKSVILAVKFIKIINAEEFCYIFDNFGIDVSKTIFKYVNKEDTGKIFEKYTYYSYKMDLLEYLLEQNATITDRTIQNLLSSSHNVDSSDLLMKIIEKDIRESSQIQILNEFVRIPNIKNVEHIVNNVLADDKLITEDIVESAISLPSSSRDDIINTFINKGLSENKLYLILNKFVENYDIKNIKHIVNDILTDDKLITENIIKKALSFSSNTQDEINNIFINKGLSQDKLDIIFKNLIYSKNVKLFQKVVESGAKITNEAIEANSHNYEKMKILMNNGAVLSDHELQLVMHTNDSNIINLVLDKEYNVDILTNILHNFVYNGSFQIIEKLITKGANITDNIMNGVVYRKNATLLQFVLDNGGVITNNNINVIIYNKDIFSLKVVLDKYVQIGKDINDINISLAIYNSDINMLNMFLEYSVDLNKEIIIKGDKYVPYIFLLVGAKNTHMLKYLLQKGANINAITREGYNVIHICVIYAVLYGIDIDLIEEYIKVGADVNNINNDGVSVLSTALTITRKLELENGTEIDIEKENSNRYQVIKILIDNGVNIREKDSSGNLLLTVDIMEKVTKKRVHSNIS